MNLTQRKHWIVQQMEPTHFSSEKQSKSQTNLSENGSASWTLHILFLITVQEPRCLVTIFILYSDLKMSQQPEVFSELHT